MYWGDVYPRSSYIILLPLFHEPIIVAFLQFTVIDRFKKKQSFNLHKVFRTAYRSETGFEIARLQIFKIFIKNNEKNKKY